MIRSPASTPTEGETPGQTRWPWESPAETEAKGAPAPKIEMGPTVRTEDLYRSHGEEAATPDAGDPSATAVVTPVTAAGADTPAAGEPGAATIPPMTTAYASNPSAVDPSGLPVQAAPESGLGTWGVALLVGGITTIVGFVDMTMNREFTWFTGVAFVIASILGALLVRPRDLWTAVITPPLAFLVALLVAGQPTTITGTGSLLIREVSLVGTGLAFNAPFIFGGTAAALVIVLVRRARIGKR